MIDKSGIHFGLGYLVWLQLFFSRYLSSFPSNLYSNPPFSSLLKMPSLLHTKFCMYLGPFLVFLFHFIHLTVCSISIFYLLELCKVLWYLIGLPFLPIFFLFFLMNFRITYLVFIIQKSCWYCIRSYINSGRFAIFMLYVFLYFLIHL